MALTTAATIRAHSAPEGLGMTLLELVTALGESGGDPDTVVEQALSLLESGRVRLTGNFRGCTLRNN